MQVENFPAHFEHYPEHDHGDDGQEEVYTVLAGSATLTAGGEEHRLEPGVFAASAPASRARSRPGTSRRGCCGRRGPRPGLRGAALQELGAALPG